MPKLSAQARARKIKLLLFDVDGVLTDGKLFFLPDRDKTHGDPSITARGSIEFKGFHAHDGVGNSLARIGGLRTGLITRRFSETVALRARDLRLEFVNQGSQDKGSAFLAIVKEAGLTPDQAAFLGDDVIDLPAMRLAGFSIAVRNARAEVKKEAQYITPNAGGEGALRDAVDFILRAQGKLKQVIDVYLGQHKSDPAVRGN